MKRAWVYMISLHTHFETIWRNYRTFYNIQVLVDARKMAGCRIRGVLKLVMKRMYAQYAEEDKLVKKNTEYFQINRELLKTRKLRNTKK